MNYLYQPQADDFRASSGLPAATYALDDRTIVALLHLINECKTDWLEEARVNVNGFGPYDRQYHYQTIELLLKFEGHNAPLTVSSSFTDDSFMTHVAWWDKFDQLRHPFMHRKLERKLRELVGFWAQQLADGDYPMGLHRIY